MATGNHLGQSSPAIADTDAEYERMWARDAAPCTPTRPPRPRRRR
ncbi:PPE domain-containing protein [Mycobacterium interjectum]